MVLLLSSNAFTLKKDKSILCSRIVIIALSSISFIALNSLFIKSLEKGIGIYGGLFNVTTFSQTFNIFIFLISAVILGLTGVFPRKVYIKPYSYIYHLFFLKFLYDNHVGFILLALCINSVKLILLLYFIWIIPVIVFVYLQHGSWLANFKCCSVNNKPSDIFDQSLFGYSQHGSVLANNKCYSIKYRICNKLVHTVSSRIIFFFN